MATQAKTETLSAAMASAFAEIEAATKDASNPHFRSKYADLGSVIDAIKPALIGHGLYFHQHTHPAEDGVMVETILYHNGGEKESLGKLYVPANKRDAQGFGSALTYARRYALMTAFGVSAEDDDGNAAAKSVANDRNGELKQQLRESVRQEERAAKRDAPFPPGPAKNKTELKRLGSDLWRDVEACGDPDQLAALLATSTELQSQISRALPVWWNGGTHESGEPFDGLATVIARRQSDLMVQAVNAG